MVPHCNFQSQDFQKVTQISNTCNLSHQSFTLDIFKDGSLFCHMRSPFGPINNEAWLTAQLRGRDISDNEAKNK